MIKNLSQVLKLNENKKYSTKSGTAMHSRMQKIMLDEKTEVGDLDIINKIKLIPGLASMFSSNSKTEVPIAGKIENKFITRRIDRLLIDNDNKKIIILDYKSDVDKTKFKPIYINQIDEYFALLKQIHPDYTINGFILWTYDWVLEKIC